MANKAATRGEGITTETRAAQSAQRRRSRRGICLDEVRALHFGPFKASDAEDENDIKVAQPHLQTSPSTVEDRASQFASGPSLPSSRHITPRPQLRSSGSRLTLQSACETSRYHGTLAAGLSVVQEAEVEEDDDAVENSTNEEKELKHNPSESLADCFSPYVAWVFESCSA